MNMTQPRLLDLFCGAGGAGMGYHRAGFDVVGVDIAPQSRWPFEFHQADAMTYPLGGFDAIHASPPCQDYSKAMRGLVSRDYPRLIEQVRDRLTATGRPWIIENVPGAPLPHQADLFGAYGVELCGTMFGLPIWRHRLFETSFDVLAPRGCDHSQQQLNPYASDARKRFQAEHGIDMRLGPWQEAMGVPWMKRDQATEAIPPAYTEYIGRQVVQHLGWMAA